MKRILIAECNEFCRQLAVKRLESLLPQSEVVVAINGLQARQILMQNGDFDLLLINPDLPSLSGLELVTEYKQDFKGKGFVVAITANIYSPKESYQYFDKVLFKPWKNFDAEILQCFLVVQ